MGGFYPTWRWRPGETVIERRQLWLPPEIPRGTYRLVARVRDVVTHAEVYATTADGIAELGLMVVGS